MSHSPESGPVSSGDNLEREQGPTTPQIQIPSSEAVGEAIVETKSVENTQSEQHEFKPISCPQCDSRRFTVIPGNPVTAKCFETDCGHVYPLTEAQEQSEPKNSAENTDIETPPKPSSSPSKPITDEAEERRARGGRPAKKPKQSQKRSYAGSKVDLLLEKAEKGELSIAPVPDQGTLERGTDELIYDGPDALVRATHQAAKLAAKFGEDFEAKWFLETEWLRSLRIDHRGCERVKYALRWRPRYLATLALSGSVILAAKRAQVSPETVMPHRVNDKDFAAQVDAARAYHGQLLLDVCMKSAIEGDCEPVYWQGIKVGHIRKYDSRLRVEMLRAYHPTLFKTPGNNVNVNVDNRKVTIMTPEWESEIQNRRFEAQRKAAELESGSRDEKPITIAELTQGQ
jgi:hypothetical protein